MSNLELSELGFDERTFREKCEQSGMKTDRMEMKLRQMQSPPSDPAEMMWAGLSRTQSGDLTRRLHAESTDFTDFCIRMAKDTICPPEYYAGFWRVLEADSPRSKTPQPASPAASSPPGGETVKFSTFEGDIALPPGVREKAVALMERNSSAENHRELGSRVLAEQWEDAFPFAIAETMQTGSPIAMKYVGACLLKTVERHAASGAITARDNDYVAGAIRCLSEAIAHGDSDWDAYQFRGASRLIAAQLNRDAKALDEAEQDFRESKRTNPTPMIERSLSALQGVRQRMF